MDSTLAADIKADIILGTYDHDRFKPFWLGQAKHALLGYMYAHTVQNKPEAYCLAILLHAADNGDFALPKLLAWHASAWPQTERRLPRALLVANWIDRIASSSYSLFGEDNQGNSLYGHYGRWGSSAQNPFSRLPLYDATLIGGRVEQAQMDGTEFAANFFRPKLPDQGPAQEWDTLEVQVRERIRTGTPVAPLPAPPPPAPSPAPTASGGGQAHLWGALLRKLTGRGEAHREPPAPAQPPTPAQPPDIDPYHQLAASLQAMSSAQAAALLGAYAVFAERNYPHPNDTSLQLHTKLAANLYHVLLQNMTDASPLSGLGLEQLDAASTAPWYAATRDNAGRQSLHTVLDLLRSSVVSVRLAGIEERFRSAVRLDDLQGAKLLADRVRRAFKVRMCCDLGLAGEAAAADGTALADLLCLSESRFTLTYLLPRSYIERDGGLLNRLYALYDDSLADVVTSATSAPPDGKSALPLLDYLTIDIQRTLDDAKKTGEVDLRPTREGILGGLRTMPPAFSVADVRMDITQARREEDFGAALVEAYAQAQGMDSGEVSVKVWDMVAVLAADEGSAAICSVTQAASAWTELSDYAYGRKQPAVEQLQQYFHTFRDEQEELSQAGVAMRALAQGFTKVDALDRLIRGTYVASTGDVEVHFVAPQPGQPPAPPLMLSCDRIGREDGLVDLSGAYVRVRRDAAKQPDPLIRFPSVTYAADRNGNVAMLTLRPTAALYQDHLLSPDFMAQVGDAPGSYGELCAAADLHRLYLNPRPAKKPMDAAQLQQLRGELARVPAHLARVLQRQETVSAFFARLPQRLEAAGVRVLTLEDRHPVGRYLLPADALVTALDVLDRSICLDLLSVNGADLGLDDTEAMSSPAACNVLGATGGREGEQRRERLRRFLATYVQDLLVGSAMVFKHKQALYLMLRAEERLQGQVERRPVLSMALSDMRGTLVDRSPLHAQYAFADWDRVHAVADSVDRRSIIELAGDWDQYDQLVAAPAEQPEAQETQRLALEQLVRARWINRLNAADVRRRVTADWLLLAEAEGRPVVDAAHLLIRAARE